VTLGIQQKPSKSRPNRIRKPRLMLMRPAAVFCWSMHIRIGWINTGEDNQN